MFGLLYGLFMGGAFLENGIRKSSENEDARIRSINNKNTICTGNGKLYFNGIRCKEIYRNGKDLVVDYSNENRVLYDRESEYIKETDLRNQSNWDEAMIEAREQGKKYFYFIRYAKTFLFKDRPTGYYEIDSCRRVHGCKDIGQDRYYKRYDKVIYPEKLKIYKGIIEEGYYVTPDYSTEVEIPYDEWRELGRNKEYIVEYYES